MGGNALGGIGVLIPALRADLSLYINTLGCTDMSYISKG